MRADLLREITRRIQTDFGFKNAGTWLNFGDCLKRGRCVCCRPLVDFLRASTIIAGAAAKSVAGINKPALPVLSNANHRKPS